MDAVGEPVYDEPLRLHLDAIGLARLRDDGRITVGGCGDPARYNAGLWFALKYGCSCQYDGATLTILPPEGPLPILPFA